MSESGRLRLLQRYPVKSMRGERLASVHVAFAGVAGDRVYAFVNNEKTGDFPWHTAREQHDLLLYEPRFLTPPADDDPYPRPVSFALKVRTPAGRELAIDDPALLAELQAKATYALSLRFSEKGMQDARPVSLIGLDTVRQLGVEAKRELDPLRFRMNFYVDWASGRPFAEDDLIGRRLKIGDTLEAVVVKKDPRCVLITLEPGTAEVHPEVLRTVARGHQGCAGVYLAVLREGVVKEGDAVAVLD